jgi:four helix bundle protein
VGRHEDLIAYRQAAALADDIRGEISTWPTVDQWTIGVQLIRAADSVGANLAESVGRSSPRGEQRFVLYARGSVAETRHWLERAFARSLLTDDSYRQRAARVGQLVNGLLRSHRRKARTTKHE